MSKFLTNLCIQNLSCDSQWALTCDLQYQSDLLNCIITIPKGFITDLASVPRIPIIFDQWGNRSHYEAVVHDYLYCTDSVPIVTCSQANEVFKEAMIVREKPWYIYHPMYAGVCLGGWLRYHRKSVTLYKEEVDEKSNNLIEHPSSDGPDNGNELLTGLSQHPECH